LKQVSRAFIVVLALTAFPAAADASCHIPGGRSIARNRVARLISVPSPGGSALFACILRTGRKVALDEPYADARLAGHWVSWQRRNPDGQWRIAVHDLRTGRERFVDGHIAGHAAFLTTTGTAVWAQQFSGFVGIFANDLRTGGHVLGKGQIDPASLRLSGRLVSWRQDGADYTADVR
jgi:hypothetical protein